MDGLDWISLHQDGFEEDSLILQQPVPSGNVLTRPEMIFPPWSTKSGGVTSWGEAIVDNTGSGLILNPGMDPGMAGPPDGLPPPGPSSLESLDCLLSASNSQTDTLSTSLEDDGISMIFSDCQGLWNFTPVKSVPTLLDTAKPSLDPDSRALIDPSRLPAPANNHTQDHHDDHHPQPNPTKRKRSESQEGLPKHDHNIPDFPQSKNAAPPGTSTTFHFTSEQKNPKRQRQDKHPIITSSNISFQQGGAAASSSASSGGDEPDAEAIAQMKEMIYRAAAFRPINFGTEAVEKPKRKNVRISNDPQTVAARQRRERISERIRVLQKLVPGGSKMDTASMLDEAANYLKFLRSQVKALEALGQKIDQTVVTAAAAAFPGNGNLAFSSPFLNYTFPHQFSMQAQNPVNKSLT